MNCTMHTVYSRYFFFFFFLFFFFSFLFFFLLLLFFFPSTFQVSLARVFLSVFRSSALSFFVLSCSQHFPQYVCFISRHPMPVPVELSLRDLVVRRMCSFLILSLRVTPHIHRSILIAFSLIRCSCIFFIANAVAEWVRALALNEWRPDILPGRVRLPLRATLSSELWQFR